MHGGLRKPAAAVRPYVRNFDSNDCFHQLASKEICIATAWSSDYYVSRAAAREDGTGAHPVFVLPNEGSNITYNALLIPDSAAHPGLDSHQDRRIVLRCGNLAISGKKG